MFAKITLVAFAIFEASSAISVLSFLETQVLIS